MEFENYNLKQKLTEKFLRYVSISSQSDETKGIVPSSEGQWTLAKLLMKEMSELGLVDISLSDKCVVIGHLPARLSNGHKPVKTVGWCCHMDTVNVCLDSNIHPIIVKNYNGEDIIQNEEKNIVMKVQDNPELLDYIGDDIILSDGKSVLGADNKAAIANVMTALEVLKEHPEIEHGEIYISFVPDEEIGLLGAKNMDYSKFPVDFAYTIDCCKLGEIVTQTFNAGSAILKIVGKSAHPMNSKNNVVNPATIAVDFINCLNPAERPEYTEKTEGFIWVHDLKCDVLNGTVQFIIRDHSLKKYQAKKELLYQALEITKMKNPKAQLTLEISDTYGNIADALNENNSECVDYLYKACDLINVVPETIAMRGGTDGSYISTKGIPTPNYFTGAHNFHASTEFLPLNSFEKSCQLTLTLIDMIAKGE